MLLCRVLYLCAVTTVVVKRRGRRKGSYGLAELESKYSWQA